METLCLPTDSPEKLAVAVVRAAAFLAAGDPVALPTETVYGLAADALNPEALVKIFEAKERPFFDPLIVHLPNHGWLERLALIPEESRALVDALIERFWPGPLTLVLPRQPIVPDLVTSGMETVAVRMSSHRVFRAVAESFGNPLAAPSANRFGRISPTAAEHVQSELDGRIPLVVDGGPTTHGIESTIVAVEGTSLRVLRSGPITLEELVSVRNVTGHPRKNGAMGITTSSASGSRLPEAPGQLASHYAPRTQLVLGDFSTSADQFGLSRVGLLAFCATPPGACYAHIEVLSPTGDLREAATTLFAKMRRLDEAGLDLIVAQSVPEQGVGVAIMDRLRRASFSTVTLQPPR